MAHFFHGFPGPRVKHTALAVAAASVCELADLVLLGVNHSGAFSPVVLVVTVLGLASALWGVRRARTGLGSGGVAVIGTVILITGFAAAYVSLDSGSFLPTLSARGSFQMALSVLANGTSGTTWAITDHANTYLHLQRLVDILYVFTALGVIGARIAVGARREHRQY